MLPDHFEKTAPGMMIVGVLSEVFGEVVDPLREECYLYLR